MLTEITDGRVQISTRCDSVQVIFKDNKEIYPYQKNGYYPLTRGAGTYKIRLLKKTPILGRQEIIKEFDVHVSMGDAEKAFASCSNVYVDSDNPKVKAFAESLVEGKEGDLDRIKAIYFFVYRKVKYNYMTMFKKAKESIYIPDLEKILKTKSGICWEKACLFVALCRAVGIKAIVRVGNLDIGDGLTEYHAWCMVECEGKMRTLDPTKGKSYKLSDYKCVKQF